MPTVVDAVSTDASLARAAAMGDRAAFDTVVDRHGPALYRYAQRILRDDAEAQDAVQDAFVAAWRHIGSFDGRASLRTWLFTLAHHKAVDLRRRRRPRPVDDGLLDPIPAGSSSDPVTVASGRELRRALDAALGELPYRQRACWLLVEVEGLSQDEVARVLVISPDSVRGHLFRARRNLRERMARWR